MQLCNSSHKRIRRGACVLLQRLSTLPSSKVWLHASGATPLLLKLLKQSPDEFVLRTAATTLAELAEEPSVRVAMVEADVLSALSGLVFEMGQPAVRFEAARALADLAEAVDNRMVISLRCSTALIDLLRQREHDDDRTIGHAIRCFANLSAPAGQTSDCGPERTGRYGAREHTEYGGDDDSDSDEEGTDDEEEQPKRAE